MVVVVDKGVPLPLQPGDQVGPYRLDAVLGMGGMGVVYRAVAPSGAAVALKTLRSDLGEEQSAASPLFLREARLAAQLVHPHLVRALDFGVWEGRSCLVMELLEGVALDTWLDTPRSAAELLAVLDGVLAALGYAHVRGVVHRDLKPSNVMVTTQAGGPHAKVMDFGVASWRRSVGVGHEEELQAVGTPAYMAPEASALGGDVSSSTDLYAFGVLLYQLLCDRLPFDEADTQALLLAHLRQAPPPLVWRAGWSGTSGWQDLVERLLAKTPEGRPRSASEVRRALSGLVLQGPEGDALCLSERLPPVEERLVAERAAVRAWDARARAGALGSPGHGLVPFTEPSFVGRDRELALVLGQIRAALSRGDTLVVLVEGAAGVGKTRFVQEFAERLEEEGLVQVWRGEERPENMEGEAGLRSALRDGLGLPLGASALDGARLRRVLDRRYAVDPKTSQTLATFLDTGATPLVEGSYAAAEALRWAAVDRLLKAAATKGGPVLLWVDGAEHGGGVAFRAFERLLDASEAGIPVVLVASYEWLGGGHAFADAWGRLVGRSSQRVLRVPLEPLSPAMTRDLVQTIAAVSSDLADWLFLETQGDLGLTRSLLVHLTSEGITSRAELPESSGRGASGMLSQWFRERFDALVQAAGVARRTVTLWQQLAFLGDDFSRELALRLDVSSAALDEALAAGLRTHLLVEGKNSSNYRFAQSLARDALVAMAEEEGAFEEGYAAAASARLGAPTVTWPERRRAARDLMEIGRWVEAAVQLELCARAAAQEGRWVECRDAWEALARMPQIPELERSGASIRARRGLAEAALRLGSYEYAVTAAAGLWKAGDQVPELARAEAAWVLGEVERERGNLRDADRWLTWAVGVFSTGQHRQGLARAALGLGRLAWRSGRPEIAEPWLATALACYGQEEDRAGEASCHLMMARVALGAGLVDEAWTWLNEAREGFVRLGDSVGESIALAVEGEILLARGEAATAVDALQQAYAELMHVQVRHEALRALLYAGRASASLARGWEAEEAYAEAREGFVGIGDAQGASLATLCLAELALDAGERTQAEAWIDEALERDETERIDEPLFVELLVTLARTLWTLGRSSRAAKMLEYAQMKLARIAEGTPLYERVDEVHFLLEEIRAADVGSE